MKLKFVFPILSILIITGLYSCNTNATTTKDARFLSSNLEEFGNIELGGFDIPTNYDLNNAFAPGSYSGQVKRLAQLQEIVDSSRNEPIYWDIANAMEVGGFADVFASSSAQNTATGSADLRSKIDELNYDEGNTSVADAFVELATNFVSSTQEHYTITASRGVAGMITTGTTKRHVDANGLEFIQILEKGLYGAIFYDQIVDDYLRLNQSGPANEAGNNQAAVSDYLINGTDRQHRWDEAFGYLGANPETYPNLNNVSNGDGVFIANYTFDFSDEIENVYGVNISEKLMEAFIKGRAILKAGESFGPESETTNEEALEAARQDVKLYVEAGIAAAAFHYLNSAISDITDEDKLHHLSESLAFIYALSFNSEGLISETEVHDVLISLGWSPTDSSLNGIYDINLWDVTDAQMMEAINILDVSYPGFADTNL